MGPSIWQPRIASSMKKIATTWAKCHEFPTCAENQTIVPNAKASDITTRKPRRTPMPSRIQEARTTLAAPSRIEIHSWCTSGPKKTIAGIITSAGAGG